jgi:hypothetical protein
MEETKSRFTWVEKAAIPLITALGITIYPFVLPILERAYGIQEQKMDAVKTEISNTVNSEETIESLSRKIEEHSHYFSSTLEEITVQVQEFNEMKESWKSSKAITLRLHDDGQITFTALDGKEYDAYWNENERVWKYIKNGNSYVIFQKED